LAVNAQVQTHRGVDAFASAGIVVENPYDFGIKSQRLSSGEFSQMERGRS
jgi:hypothetical protein